MKNRKLILENPFFVHFKKHNCPFCHGLLKTERIKRIINSKSEEAKDFDFSVSGGDGFMYGDVQFSYEVFVCQRCNKQFSVKEIKFLERKNK